jgi:hypothetical protein
MQCIHHIPGRLRVRVAGIKGDAQGASRLGCLLREVDGVTSVAANPLTGSVLVHYDPATLCMSALMARIPASEKPSRHGPTVRKRAVEPKTLGQEVIRRIAAAAAKQVLEAAVERAVVALIAAIL